MAHGVFICYAKEDRDRAQEICDSLEARGIQCWIAPRDVPPGAPYARAIIDAIRESRVLVLVFSCSANDSEHVLREVESAADNNIPIIPFQIEDVLPSEEMTYYIKRVQWLDAFAPPFEQHLERLYAAVEGMLRRDATVAVSPAQPGKQAVSASPRAQPAKAAMMLRNPRLRVAVGGVVALAALAFAMRGVVSSRDRDEIASKPPVTHSVPPPMTDSEPQPSPELDYCFVLEWGSRGAGDGQFEFPRGVATDPDGNVYVTDSGNHRIQKFTNDGRFLTKWGSKGDGDGQFNHPIGVATDARGNVYVTDVWNYRIQKFDSHGNFERQWGSQGSGYGEFHTPRGVATDPDGNVYVADSSNYRIQKFDGDGNFVLEWGSQGSGYGEFDAPRGVTTDPDGNVYVTDSANWRMQTFKTDGTFLSQWGAKGNGDGEFNRPHGVAADGDGNVFVTDSENDRIQKFDRDGRFLTKWGTLGLGYGEFESPFGVATDADGNVFVADQDNHRIQKFARQ